MPRLGGDGAPDHQRICGLDMHLVRADLRQSADTHRLYVDGLVDRLRDDPERRIEANDLR